MLTLGRWHAGAASWARLAISIPSPLLERAPAPRSMTAASAVPKVGRALEPCSRAQTRGSCTFAVAGLEDMRDSFSLAMNWASQPWDRHFERIERAAAAVPRISTGNDDWDRVIDLSYAHLIKAFIASCRAFAASLNRRQSGGQSRLEPARRRGRSYPRLGGARADPRLSRSQRDRQY